RPFAAEVRSRADPDSDRLVTDWDIGKVRVARHPMLQIGKIRIRQEGNKIYPCLLQSFDDCVYRCCLHSDFFSSSLYIPRFRRLQAKPKKCLTPPRRAKGRGSVVTHRTLLNISSPLSPTGHAILVSTIPALLGAEDIAFQKLIAPDERRTSIANFSLTSRSRQL